MDNRNLEKATEIFGALLVGEEISLTGGKNAALYETYTQNAEVSEMVDCMLKQLNLKLYEYNYGLYVTAGAQNRVFGYSNDELKRMMGLRLNRELYLAYYVMYTVMQHFYSDSATYTYAEYVRPGEIITAVDMSLSNLIGELSLVVRDELEEESFRTIAMTWDELPVTTKEEGNQRAARGSRTGFVRLVFNFLTSQGLFAESGEKYYPTDRFHGMVRCYFEEERTRLYEISAALGSREMQEEPDGLRNGEENAAY